MLNSQEARKRAQDIELALGQIPVADAFQVLLKAMERIARRAGMSGNLSMPALTSDMSLLNRKRSKIESDPEVRRFIHEYGKSMPYHELAAACRERFGENRAPSKSGIGRYVQKLREQKGCNDD